MSTERLSGRHEAARDGAGGGGWWAWRKGLQAVGVGSEQGQLQWPSGGGWQGPVFGEGIFSSTGATGGPWGALSHPLVWCFSEASLPRGIPCTPHPGESQTRQGGQSHCLFLPAPHPRAGADRGMVNEGAAGGPHFEKTAHSVPVTLRWMARGDQEGLL